MLLGVDSKFLESFRKSCIDISLTEGTSTSYSCKKLKPIYDTLGERFANVKSKLTIAKFDATENDIPASAGFKVQGFPTISKLHLLSFTQ